MELTERELATVLAALRLFQEQRESGEKMPHFEEWTVPSSPRGYGITPLTDEEIDELCETLNCNNP